MPNTVLTVEAVSHPLRTAFSISRGTKTSAETVQVTLRDGDYVGRGESVPYDRYSESIESVIEEIEARRVAIESGLSRVDLQDQMYHGAARCAVDCAMWDLEAKRTGEPVWKLLGVPEPAPVTTAVTIVLEDAAKMAEAAQSAESDLLKLKLGGEADLARVEGVHKARPDARLILDANEALDPADLPALVRQAEKLGVVLIEQPFPAQNDSGLLKRPGSVAICADESAHTSDDIQALAKRYDAVNIKLDKAGGLTEAMAMMRAARASGMGVMVGCMVASSLSMAPAMMLAGLADAVDLDGPIWLAEDVEHGLSYPGGRVSPPTSALWG